MQKGFQFTLVALVSAWVALVFDSQAQQMLVIPVSNRSAEEIVEAAQPFFKDRAVLGAFGDKIIARVQPEDIRELKSLVARLDQKIRSLRLSFRVEGSHTEEATQVSARAKIGSPGAQASVLASQQARDANTGNVQSVTAAEGSPARMTIQSGATSSHLTFQARTVGSTTAFVTLTQADSGAIGLMAVGSTVSGPIGSWIPLAENHEATNQTGGSRKSKIRAYVKIELL